MCNVVPSVEELSKLSSKDPVICSICNKCFQGQSALKTHLKRSHKAVNVRPRNKHNSILNYFSDLVVFSSIFQVVNMLLVCYLF